MNSSSTIQHKFSSPS